MDHTRERRPVAGSVIRGLVLLTLVLVIAPAVVRDGDDLAIPAVTLVSLAAIAVAIAGLVYWLVTAGVAAPWFVRRLRLTPDRVLIVGASVVGVLAAVALAWSRFELNRRHSLLGQFDLRAASTAARLSSERPLMQTLNMAGIRAMLVLGFTLVVAAAVARAFRSAALLAATMAVGGALVEVLKTQPVGPLPALGEVARGSTSWPSGHAALQGSVALGVVMWWWAARLPRPSLVAAVALPLAALVGYSRAFLGFHFLSEILAGWCVAAIAAAVVLVVDRLLVTRLTIPPPPQRWPLAAAGIAAVVLTALAVHSVHHFHQGGGRPPPGFEAQGFPGFAGSARSFGPIQLNSADPGALLGRLPHFTETLLGRRDQPVGLVVVAGADQLQTAIEHAGWTPAEVFTPRHLASDLWAGVTGGTAHNAPIAPTFFDTRAADVVIQHAVPGQRGETEVAELWQVPLVTPRGCPVWAVSAALDARTNWSWRTLFPERRIDPQVDGQRDALARALATPGDLDDLGRFRFVGPTHGTTPAGSYSTDGKVALLRQKGC